MSAPLGNVSFSIARDGLELRLSFRPYADDVQRLGGDSDRAAAVQALAADAMQDLLWRVLHSVQPQLARAQSELHAAVQVAFLELQVARQRQAAGIKARGEVPA